MDIVNHAEGLFIGLCRGLASVDDARILGKGYSSRRVERGLEHFESLKRWLSDFWGPCPPPHVASFMKDLDAERDRIRACFSSLRRNPHPPWQPPYSSGTTKASLLLAEFFVRTTGQQQPERVARILYKEEVGRGRTKDRRRRKAAIPSRLAGEYPRELVERIAAKLRQDPFQSNEELAKAVKQTPENVDEIRFELAEAKEVPDGKRLVSNMRKRIKRGIPKDPRLFERGYMFEATWFMHISPITGVLPPDKQGRYITIPAEGSEEAWQAAMQEYVRRPDCELVRPPKRLLDHVNARPGKYGTTEEEQIANLTQEAERTEGIGAFLRLMSMDSKALGQMLIEAGFAEEDWISVSGLLPAFIPRREGE